MQQRARISQKWWVAALLALTVLGLAACQPIQPEPATGAAAPAAAETAAAIPQVTIKAQDFAFDMPDELPSGLVSLTLTNEGAVNHHAIVARLVEGVTLDQVKEALAAPEGEGEGNDVQDLLFMMPDTAPGASNQATVDLAPGAWVIFSVSMDGQMNGQPAPDWALGSIKQFTVAGAASAAAAPQPDLVLTIGADDVDMPAEVPAGRHTIQVVNESGAEDGYAFFLRLEDGATVEDILASFEAFFAGEEVDMAAMPTFHAVGGLMGHTLGESFYTTVDLPPGDYAVITSIGNTGFPYAGLNRPFTVK